MTDSGYLTIEETARKLSRPASWVKDQICEGNLGATLAGRQWLISPQDANELLRKNTPPPKPGKIVHNFLQDRPARESHSTQNEQNAGRPTRKNGATERSRKSSHSAKNKQPVRTAKDKKPTLTQRIKDLDREFDRLSNGLKAAMLKYRAAIKSGKTVKPPNNLIHRWRTAKAELKYLIDKADAKGLVLPTDLSIYRILAQEANSVEQRGVSEGSVTRTKSPGTVKGIDGYYAGPGRADPQMARAVPPDVEARLIILRNRERAAAHSMQDRGKSRAARDAAAATWAQTRQEAERVERELQAARRPLREGETKTGRGHG